jgi:predicted aspartyl protease
MKNKYLRILVILIIVLPFEMLIFFALTSSQRTQLGDQYEARINIEKLNQEKEKKELNDEFEKNKYLATGESAYERIYNEAQEDIVDLIKKLAVESFPANWRIEVKVEEFTNLILLVQVDATSGESKISEIVKYLKPILGYSDSYLKNVAIYNRKHQCYLFFDGDALVEITKTGSLEDQAISDARKKAESFARYNSITIDFQDKSGHIFIPVTVSGNSGSYETVMMLDTGASITMISLELAQKTGQEDLNKVSRRTFSTAKGLMSCPIVEREVVVAGLDKKQSVAVNLEDDSNLLGVDFFESRGYIIDNSSKCIYVWSK